MNEDAHVSATDRSHPLTHYSQNTIEPSSSKFIDVYNHPVLLYSKSPGRLKDIWAKLTTTLIEIDKDQSGLRPAETKPRIDDIRVIEIRKYSNYPPAERITVGRVDSNDIVFSHGAISKVHAYLVKTEPGVSYEIIDVNSTNGTRVNDQELPAFKNQTLVNLDQIEFGKAVRAVYLTPRGFYEFVNDLIRVGMI